MTIKEELAREELEREQARRRAKAQEQREKVAKRKLDTRRNIIVGALVSGIFPELKGLQLHRTRAANGVEFAPLEAFLTELAADTEYVARIKERAMRKLSRDI